jgi:hypothetical protein
MASVCVWGGVKWLFYQIEQGLSSRQSLRGLEKGIRTTDLVYKVTSMEGVNM